MAGREIAARPQEKGALWKARMEKWKPSMLALLPKEITPERMTRLVLTTFQKNPKLMECNEASVFGSVMEAVKLGLEIDCAQQAWLVPYGAQCQLIVGYQGLAQLCFNSGMVTSIAAHVVRSNDLFEYEETHEGTKIRHKPHWIVSPGSDPGALMAVYSIIKMPNGETKADVFGRHEIEQHKAASVAASRDPKSPWHTDEPAMWKKTAVRISTKLLPKSTQGAKLMRAVEIDEQAERGAQDFSIEADFTIEAEAKSAVEKPRAAAAEDGNFVITSEEAKALFAMAEQRHGAKARDVVKAVLTGHEIRIAAHIKRSQYGQIWEEVEASGGVAGKREPAQAEDQPDAGPDHDRQDQGQRSNA